MKALFAMNRRRFIRTSLAAGAVAATTSALPACSTGTAADNSTEQNLGVALPTYVKYEAIKPDLVGNNEGLLDGFLRYPENPKKAFDAPPGKGGNVSAFVQTTTALAPGLSSNKYWQELNKQLGVNLELAITPAPNLAQKFATLIAGDDLPDLLYIVSSPRLPQLLAAKCLDLTEFLSGDAAKDYPFLANIPTASWRQTVYNGGIYGLPVARGVGGDMLMCRADIFRQKGVTPDVSSFDEFLELCRAVTDAKANRWAIGLASHAFNFTRWSMGLPNTWREEGGKLTHICELDEQKQALEIVTKMISDGLVHPDGFSPNAKAKVWFGGGTIAMTVDRYIAWRQFLEENIAVPGFEITGMRPPQFDGGKDKAPTWQASQVNNITAFKKADKNRIKELLTIANWFASPFGTQEYLFRKFGVLGTHYEVRDGAPVLNQTGINQTSLGVRYITDSPDILYQPGRPEVCEKEFAYQQAIIPTSVKNPVIGWYSDTAGSKGSQLDKLLTDAQNDIMQGRKPVTYYDEVVRSWRQQGGDAMRSEYEEQLQSNGGN